MIDIHCHILAGVDDGPKTIEQSLAMAKLAVEEGITTIIATPHHFNGSYENSREKIFTEVDMLNEVLLDAKIPLTILPGQETRIHGEMVKNLEKAEILTLNNTNKYLFVELPSDHVPRYTNKLLYDIQLQGLTPIIVHPERNSEIIETPDLLYKLVESGALTQVTASSVTGRFGKKIKKFTNDLIEHNLTHFIASDAHNTTSRSFHLREAYELIDKQYGVSYRYLFQENTELLVKGSFVSVNQPEKIKRKKFLGIF
ncbi:tyrosine protein phosphatase [Anaerobacillus alkaliphilus]|uniref:Tyrosine-protein phosphatase n=1 Tax=Anaerobacillus alkaliphilus TaxID=1548597 RepID=A0A4Q0VVZ9_9BACI|nr:CpsB/CapC family capsule biosynthesis tyrosine phosphatase [Anaerobacillus alkaliphilus]RXJ02262.1 tyrosine protein phosphatase [Anaerobacillus alkaliphilus]